ncbi:MAG: hypothetical protein JWN11_2002 [Hyphomicrobiales bacterium]|nr:hypothetical protein [Hyphomicrobiales bacterium]
MTWGSVTYLVGFYWPYLSAVLVIGFLTGWLSRPGSAPGQRTGKPYD